MIELTTLPLDKEQEFVLYMAFLTAYRFVHSQTIAEIATVYQLTAKHFPMLTAGGGPRGLMDTIPLKLSLFDNDKTVPVIPMELPGRRLT
jgi:hypothetical protein